MADLLIELRLLESTSKLHSNVLVNCRKSHIFVDLRRAIGKLRKANSLIDIHDGYASQFLPSSGRCTLRLFDPAATQYYSASAGQRSVRGQAERASLQAERARLQNSLARKAVPIEAERIRQVLGNLTKLLVDGAAGQLGEDAVYKAASVFRQLVGGRINVQVERRPARQRTNVRGAFVPRLLQSVQAELQCSGNMASPEPTAVIVWLREPPKRDQLAERVHNLIDVENQSFRTAEKTLRAEGHNVNSGVVWQIYHRYYEMINQPVPELSYNNGNRRSDRTP